MMMMLFLSIVIHVVSYFCSLDYILKGCIHSNTIVHLYVYIAEYNSNSHGSLADRGS
jgi:hypothetical protein